MALASAQVIDAIAARLETVTLSAGRVFTGRGWALGEPELPGWTVQADDESVEPQTIHYPALQLHTLSVSAAGKVRAVSGMDDAMHALAAAGLRSLFDSQAHASLAPLVGVDMVLAGIGRDIVAGGESALGEITLRLTVTYRTSANDPETFI